MIYRQMARKGLESIDNVGPKMAAVVEGLIKDLSGVQLCATFAWSLLMRSTLAYLTQPEE